MSATDVLLTLSGVDVTGNARWGSCAIQDVLNAAPNTATLALDIRPTVGQDVKIGLGSLATSDLLFGGTIQEVGESYQDLYQNLIWPVTCTDYTFLINRRRPFGTWVATSATTIAQSLVTNYASGFTSVGVAASLEAVSIVFDGSDDFMTCIGRLATLIGGYCYVDYGKDVHLFLTEVTSAPNPIDATHRPLNEPAPITFHTDGSQVRNRVYGKGHADPTPCAVLAADTIVPLVSTVMFGTVTAGGTALAGTTSDGAQSQILTYTGVQAGGAGSFVGPGVAPSVKPTLRGAVGAGFSDGDRTWAYTWVTAAGESLPSPLSVTVTAATVPTPGAIDAVTTGAVVVGGPRAGAIQYALTLVKYDSGAQSVIGPVYSSYTALGNHNVDIQVTLTAAMVGYVLSITRSDDAGVTWYGPNGVGLASDGLHTVTVYSGIIGYVWHATDDFFNASNYVTSPPTTGAGAISNQAAISGVAIGPTGTTSRKIYRTVAAGSQLKLQQTIANNTATTGVTDATVDGSLGANAPTSDTSGLTQPTGQVNAGSTSILTASAGPFSATGGWAIAASSTWVRYTGISGNTITGIPASGAGALSSTVKYGDRLDPAPALTGVTGNTLAMDAGTPVSIWVQRNDTAAQAYMALAEGGDGIREYLIIDARRGEVSLTALCDADLEKFARPLVSVTYSTNDPLTRSGKSVSISLAIGTWDVMFDPLVFGDVIWGEAGSFTIQSVDIAFDAPGAYPRYTVRAASTYVSLIDFLLRQLPLAA